MMFIAKQSGKVCTNNHNALMPTMPAAYAPIFAFLNSTSDAFPKSTEQKPSFGPPGFWLDPI
jgi:hypothetical protein